MNDINEVYEFIKKCGTYYLATVEGDQPRVRPLEQSIFLKESFTFRQEKLRKFQSRFRKIQR